jgi:hypothetical protein
LTYNAADG